MISSPFQTLRAEVAGPGHRVAVEEVVRPDLDPQQRRGAGRAWSPRSSLTPLSSTEWLLIGIPARSRRLADAGRLRA